MIVANRFWPTPQRMRDMVRADHAILRNTSGYRSVFSAAGINSAMTGGSWAGLIDHLSQTQTQGHAVAALAWLVIVNAGMNPDRLKSTAHGKRPFLCCDALAGFLPEISRSCDVSRYSSKSHSSLRVHRYSGINQLGQVKAALKSPLRHSEARSRDPVTTETHVGFTAPLQ